jgi:valyl-tRNA synthetase
LSEETQSIITLAKGVSEVQVLQSGNELPVGCALYTITEEINVHLLVKGQVDIESEVQKLEKKIANVDKSKQGLIKKMNVPDYENKVPSDVREANDTKVCCSLKETFAFVRFKLGYELFIFIFNSST